MGQRGLFEKWICFGVVAATSSDDQNEAPDQEEELTDDKSILSVTNLNAERKLTLTNNLERLDLAYSLSPSGKLRLFMCPVLRKLLKDVAGYELVVEDAYPGLTHAELVAKGARVLCDGEEEGIVVVYKRSGSAQSSIRKWKNSAEGGTVASRHATVLRKKLHVCDDLAAKGELDDRVPKMLATMVEVAEFQTMPSKKGRTAADRS